MTLFQYRRLIDLLDTIEGDNSEFLQLLVRLQEEIYDLDALLESTWSLEQKDFDIHWQILSNTLCKFGIALDEHDDYLSHIKAYLNHELMLRQGISPTDLDLEEYYYYKSCDVQLQRRLLLDAFGELGALTQPEDWRYFDYITEINDDVMDLVEDHDAINGNGVAFYIHNYGMVEAVRILTGFVNSAMACHKARIALYPDNPMLLTIDSWTEEVGKQTKLAIDQMSGVLLHSNLNIEENKTIRLVEASKLSANKEIEV